MKRLHHYIMESITVNEYRLKTIEELSDSQIDKLEKHLRKYEAYDIETPKRTIMQTAPLDFYNKGACEVYIIDFKTKLPLSPTVLVNELIPKLGISEGNIRVRDRNSPAEEIAEKHMKENSEDYEQEEYSSLLLDKDYTEYENPNSSDFYGEEFKTKFMKELEKQKKPVINKYEK